MLKKVRKPKDYEVPSSLLKNSSQRALTFRMAIGFPRTSLSKLDSTLSPSLKLFHMCCRPTKLLTVRTVSQACKDPHRVVLMSSQVFLLKKKLAQARKDDCD